MQAQGRATFRSPVAWSFGLLVALMFGLASLMLAVPSLPHPPAFVFLVPMALAAWSGSWTHGTVVTLLAVLGQLGLSVLHPNAGGLTDSVLMRSAGLAAAGAALCALGSRIRRSQVRTREALESYRMAAELHRHSEQRLRSLLAREHSAVEGERRRVARELHDDLQQRLAAISIELAALRQQLPSGQEPLDLGLKRATILAVDAVVATRRIVAGLRPKVLDELGLPDALRHLGQEFTRRTGVACTVEVDEALTGDEALPAPEADGLYRVAQEALHNVERHAHAHQVHIGLKWGAARLVELHVVDDGSGLPMHALDKPESFGLLGMRERMRELGGQLEVQAAPGGGTQVRASVGWSGGEAPR